MARSLKTGVRTPRKRSQIFTEFVAALSVPFINTSAVKLPAVWLLPRKVGHLSASTFAEIFSLRLVSLVLSARFGCLQKRPGSKLISKVKSPNLSVRSPRRYLVSGLALPTT